MIGKQINVHNLPRHVAEDDLAGSAAVVIDLLRATSTICQAIASGATEVIPCLEINDAIAIAERLGRSTVQLGGERKGGKIPGFDLGNSPSEYTPDSVRGRTVIITTTNGTRALHHARKARRIILASFLNLSAVIESLADEPRIDIVCAGTDGGETREDVLAAGAIVSKLCAEASGNWQLNDAAKAAREMWQKVVLTARAENRLLTEQLADELLNTLGGRNCVEAGNAADICDCAQIDSIHVAPELNAVNCRVTA